MTDHFLDASASIVDQILDTGDLPKRFTVTSQLYRHIDFDGSGEVKPNRAHYQGEMPETLYGCPVFVEPGAHHAWRIFTEDGELYDEYGLVRYV